MRKVFILLILILPFIFGNSVFAHPGRTAADGCHYCRTNCDSWGVAWDERHCHGGGTVQGVQESAPIYNPPTNTPIPLPTSTPYIPPPTLRPTSFPTRKPSLTRKPTPINKPTLRPTKTKVNKPKRVNKKVVEKKNFFQRLFNR